MIEGHSTSLTLKEEAREKSGLRRRFCPSFCLLGFWSVFGDFLGMKICFGAFRGFLDVLLDHMARLVYNLNPTDMVPNKPFKQQSDFSKAKDMNKST